MSRIIGLAGYAQTGKDTVAGMLREEGYRRLAFADKLRAVVYATDPWVPDGDGGYMVRLQDLVNRIGWDRAKVENAEVRRLLQKSGETQRLLVDDDIWVRAAFKDMRLGRKYVISDVRFPNEAAAIVAKGGQVWRVVRPGYGPVNDHVSETAMDDYPAYDFKVVNDGSLLDLQRRVLWGLYRPPSTTAADDEAAADYDGDWASAQAAKAGRHFTGGPKRHDVV